MREMHLVRPSRMTLNRQFPKLPVIRATVITKLIHGSRKSLPPWPSSGLQGMCRAPDGVGLLLLSCADLIFHLRCYCCVSTCVSLCRALRRSEGCCRWKSKPERSMMDVLLRFTWSTGWMSESGESITQSRGSILGTGVQCVPPKWHGRTYQAFPLNR